MTNPDYRHIIMIVDRSGSMRACKAAAEEGIDALFAGQAKDTGDGGGYATASLYQFDTEHDVVFAHTPLAEVPAYNLEPRGGTALLDAIGFAFAQEGEWLASIEEHERPATVIAVIAADGMEHASREFKRPQIKDVITHQLDVYNWTVLFIGANMDAVQIATSYGIPAQHAMTFRASPPGTASALTSVHRALSRGRSGHGYGFTAAERAEAMTDFPDNS